MVAGGHLELGRSHHGVDDSARIRPAWSGDGHGRSGGRAAPRGELLIAPDLHPRAAGQLGGDESGARF
jgi:hypothetical protein